MPFFLRTTKNGLSGDLQPFVHSLASSRSVVASLYIPDPISPNSPPRLPTPSFGAAYIAITRIFMVHADSCQFQVGFSEVHFQSGKTLNETVQLRNADGFCKCAQNLLRPFSHLVLPYFSFSSLSSLSSFPSPPCHGSCVLAKRSDWLMGGGLGIDGCSCTMYPI